MLSDLDNNIEENSNKEDDKISGNYQFLRSKGKDSLEGRKYSKKNNLKGDKGVGNIF